MSSNEDMALVTLSWQCNSQDTETQEQNSRGDGEIVVGTRDYSGQFREWAILNKRDFLVKFQRGVGLWFCFLYWMFVDYGLFAVWCVLTKFAAN